MDNHLTTVLIVEDHPLTRQSLSFGLRKVPNLTVVGELTNGQEAVDKVKKLKPDVILMDLVMPVLSGIKATKFIKQHHPDCKVIILSSHDDKNKVFSAFRSGADAYCLKDIDLNKLSQIISMVAEGAIWIDPGISGLILKMLPLLSKQLGNDEIEKPAIELTSRESEILVLITEGLNNKDIAEKLSISLYTVKNHVSKLIQKLAVDDRTQAAIFALKEGII